MELKFIWKRIIPRKSSSENISEGLLCSISLLHVLCLFKNITSVFSWNLENYIKSWTIFLNFSKAYLLIHCCALTIVIWHIFDVPFFIVKFDIIYLLFVLMLYLMFYCVVLTIDNMCGMLHFQLFIKFLY